MPSSGRSVMETHFSASHHITLSSDKDKRTMFAFHKEGRKGRRKEGWEGGRKGERQEREERKQRKEICERKSQGAPFLSAILRRVSVR